MGNNCCSENKPLKRDKKIDIENPQSSKRISPYNQQAGENPFDSIPTNKNVKNKISDPMFS